MPKLGYNTAEELRSEVYRILRQPHQFKPNLKREEVEAVRQLKADKNQMVLTADMGVALVVIDKVDYIKKAKELLQDTSTYRTSKGTYQQIEEQTHQHTEEDKS